jgi:stage II sporulation protein AA (anti-sigma F factor antagonist)
MTLDYESGEFGGRITIAGEIDHHAAVGAIEKIDRLLDEYQPGVVSFDLGGVTFMDSSGIALILFADKRQRQIGGSLYIVNVPPQPLRVLSSAGINKMIKTEKRGTGNEKIRQNKA